MNNLEGGGINNLVWADMRAAAKRRSDQADHRGARRMSRTRQRATGVYRCAHDTVSVPVTSVSWGDRRSRWGALQTSDMRVSAEKR